MLRFFLICAIGFWALPLDVSAEEILGETEVQGASLVGNYWGALYLIKKCFACSEPQEEDMAGPLLVAHLVRVYRANADEGEITVSYRMKANSPFRTQLGESVHQGVTIVHPFNYATVASDTGPPSEELQAQLSFDWSKDRCEARVLMDIRMGVNVWFPGVELWYNGVGVVHKIQTQIIILPPQPSLVLNPADAPARSGQPWLIDRLNLGYNFRISACGLNPFLQLDQLAFNGAGLDEVPFEMVNQFAEKQLDPGTFMTRRNQPSGETRIKPGHAIMDPGEWLNSLGDCCRPSTYAPFAFPEGNSLGSHRVTVTFKPVERGFLPIPKSDDVGPVTMESEFVVFGPLVSLSSSKLSPGETVVATGTGFAPSSTVRVYAKVRYYMSTPPFERGERQIELGTAFTGLDGAFSESFTLPPRGDAFWSDLLRWGLDPPIPERGILRFYIDDLDFHLNYDHLDSDERFCRVDVSPEGEADGECPIKTGVIAEVEFVKPADSGSPQLGANHPSQDLDDDGRFEDVDGNGSLEFADAVLLAQYVAEPELAEHVAAFDFNGNARLDYADAVLLGQQGKLAQSALAGRPEDSSPTAAQATIQNGDPLALTTGEVIKVPLTLGEVIGGLSGFLLEFELEGSAAKIADITPLAFDGAKRVELAGDGRSARVLSVDFDSVVEPGAESVPLVQVDLRGEAQGTATLNIWALQMDDDSGYPILIDFAPLEIVVREAGAAKPASIITTIFNPLLMDE
jgi:hypothetical protein